MLTKTSQAMDLLWQLTQSNQGPMVVVEYLLLRREIPWKAIDPYFDPVNSRLKKKEKDKY